ncbi:VOC family protein [Nitratireductor rhodophyticola]|uniref:VOC family protein n=1 Tax=Nitratireductor rhodophyticola TaxID=2854036 RepID=UPI002AC97544|nr:VOC family protein [Nitratireductor rhodophyticola]MEC9245667.1 VOC family protein [Pseudomonadota bacterium]WPZ15504.1 VOC family protein [Nitratireductor rhodophyticola]
MNALNDKSSSAILAVSDIDRARRFYSDVLELELNDEGMEGVLVYKTGATHLVVYPSEFAGTNKANAVVWDCGQEFNAIVADLRAKGVTFERYEMEGASYKDGVYDANGFKMVWFKDPDGNILHLNSA